MLENNKINFRNQKFFIGIDVHLKSWKITIRNNQMELITFSMNPSPDELYKYLHRHYPNGDYFSTYEAGFCGFWIHRRLKNLGINNMVIHPADVPTTNKEKSNKTDRSDSRKLARELENKTLKGIYIPDEFHQQLRSLQRLRYRQIQTSTRLKNRIKAHLYMNGVQIPPHSDLYHWSGRFIQWLKSLNFSYSPARDYLHVCIEELESCRQRIVVIVRLIRKYCNHPNINEIIHHLCSVPGIGFITAVTFYSELIDISRFKSLDTLSSYIGLVPSEKSSGDREIKMGLTYRRNKYLRHLIIESAWIAIRKDPAMLQTFNHLTQRMKKQDAIIRIARKLLNRIRYVWKNQINYTCAVVH